MRPESAQAGPAPARSQDAPRVESFAQRFRAQFGHPHGFWGFVAGQIMARRPSNRRRSEWTVELLEVQPADRVLEIGFDPGLAVECAARRATRGHVVGLDHSELMVRQARRRNAAAVREGRVDLRLGTVSRLPAFEAPFDKILAVNSLLFWDQPAERLRPGGRIAITTQPRAPGATAEDARRIGEEVATLLAQAGFAGIRQETLPLKPVPAVCVLGEA